MQRTWSFTDIEFLVLWEEFGEEFLPQPLSFASRTDWWDDHLANKALARDALRDRDPELAEVLYAFRNPDVLVEVRGWDGRDRLSAAGTIRALGVRYGELGYLLLQKPGETYRHSSGFVISECSASRLASEVLTALPDTPAGRERDVVLAETEHTEEFDYAFGMSPAHETIDGTVVDRAAEFLATPATSVGTMDVVQGHSRFGPRGITRYQVQWRDLTDDGRYIVSGYPPVAAPADRRRLIAALDAHIAEVVLVMADE